MTNTVYRASATSALRGLVPTPIHDALLREQRLADAKATHPATVSKVVSA